HAPALDGGPGRDRDPAVDPDGLGHGRLYAVVGARVLGRHADVEPYDEVGSVRNPDAADRVVFTMLAADRLVDVRAQIRDGAAQVVDLGLRHARAPAPSLRQRASVVIAVSRSRMLSSRRRNSAAREFSSSRSIRLESSRSTSRWSARMSAVVASWGSSAPTATVPAAITMSQKNK